ncbi:MAG: hypothetical protein CSA49_05225 [Gammaproteobacteria bacterium]|nr:MAG: hypothetical protein CSA49_05225 [Gammaproteobacteria bacterium]
MLSQAGQLRLKIPPHDLEMLSFAIANPRKIKEWADALPRMNIGECARQLYTAIQEINRFKTDSDTRFAMLEALRGPIHYVCESLSSHYLNRSIILPAKEAKIASLAQALQNHLSIGYKSVVAQQLPRLKIYDKDAHKLSAKAIHRAYTEKAHVLLRSLQLYYPAPINFWREAHLLYAIAERFKLLQTIEQDPEVSNHPATTCLDMYKRLLLLTTAKPNQLRQHQIKQVYDATAQWVKFTELSTDSEPNGLFAIDLISDTPPIYNALMRHPDHTPDNVNVRFFDAATISDHLRVQLQLPEDQQHPVADFAIPEDMGKDVIRLLIQAWGTLTERAFSRIKEAGQLKVCVGLSATHYFVSGKADFNAMIHDAENSGVMGVDFDNQFTHVGPTHRRDIIEKGDVWGLQVNADNNALDSKQHAIEEEIAKFSGQATPGKPDKYPSYICNIVNTSPGGYCLSWTQDAPPQVKTGEIIGLQETPSAQWSIGVIRWVKQFKNEGARMGIELLAPKAQACGSQAIHKKGSMSEYMRTLILPELRATGQTATLITPSITFHVGYKVNMNQNGHVTKAQLVKQVASTASFNQFQYKPLTATASGASQQPTATNTGKSKPDNNDFDSVWSSL